MMVTARKVVERDDQIRYEFGLDRQYDRVLVIDKQTWDVATEDGTFDSAAGAIAAKIKNAWREQGEFPAGVIFAS
jgi:hypothetical protein